MSTGVSNLNRVFTTVGSPVRWLGSGVESITGKNSVTEFLKSDLVTGAVGGLILGGNPITGAVGMSTGAAVGAGAALGQGYNEAKEASSQAEAAANQSAGATRRRQGHFSHRSRAGSGFPTFSQVARAFLEAHR